MLFAWTTYYFIWIIWTRITISKQVGKVNFLTWKREFDLTGDQLQKVYILPHTVCCEPYIKAFQYKVLNSILYTNTKLYKIGFATDDTCSFCKPHPETVSHLLFDCTTRSLFGKSSNFIFILFQKKFISSFFYLLL